MVKSKKMASLLLAAAIVVTSFTPVLAVDTVNETGDYDSILKSLTTTATTTATITPNTFSDVSGNYQDAIEVLSSLKVINGYADGTYKPTQTITRAELAKLLVEALGYGNIVQGMENVGKNVFDDTQNHWAKGHITIAHSLDLIKGDGNGKFRPDDTVSYNEAYTMIVRSLGYTEGAVTGSWPYNYTVKASELKLMDGVNMENPGADRGGVAQILYNALEVPLVKLSINGIVVTDYQSDGKTPKLLLDKIANYTEDYYVSVDVLDSNSKNYAGDRVDLTDHLYQTLTVYLDGDGKVIYVKESHSLVVTGEIDKADKDFIYIKGDSKKSDKVVISKDATAFFNGGEVHDYDMSKLFAENEKNPFDNIIIVADDLNNNGSIDKENEIVGLILDQPTESFVVEEGYNEKRARLDNIKLPTNKKDEIELGSIIVTGDATKLEDIQKKDVVVIYEGKDSLKIVVTRDKVVEGKVSRITSSTNTVRIDGEEYEVSKIASAVYINSIRLLLGDEGEFFLDHNGKIVGFDVESTERENYAVVIGLEDGIIEDGRFNSKEIKYYPSIKLALGNGRTEVIDFFVEIDEDGSLDETVVYDTEYSRREEDLLEVTGNRIRVISSARSDLLRGEIIKYSLNKYGEIEAITLLREETLNNVRTDSKSFELADNAIIFKNDGKNFSTVRESYLMSRISGKAIYNNNDEIEVLLVNEDSLGIEADEILVGYLASTSEIARGYDKNNEIVQIPTLIVGDEEVEFYTSEDKMFTVAGVYRIEIEDDIIVKATLVTPTLAQVVSKSNRDGRLELKIGEVTGWFYLSNEPTMVEIDRNYVDPIDLYDVETGKLINIYMIDSEVAYVGIGNIFIPTYKVTYSVVGENGTLTSAVTSESSVIEYTSVKFTATPSEGYEIKEWKVNGVARVVEGNELTLPVAEITTVTVEFQAVAPTQHLVSYSVVNNTGGTITSAVETAAEVVEGTEVVFTIEAEEGYVVKEVKVNDVATVLEGNELTLTIDKATVITVEFEAVEVSVEEFALTYSVVGENGTITSDIESATEVEEGTEVELTITAAEGFEVKELLVNGEVVELEGNVLTLTITETTVVTVEFQEVI